MKNQAIIVILLTALLPGMRLQAQTDPHFSQYYVYPLWLNPGLTGVMDGDYRVTAVYRRQWGNVASPFTTPGISADMSTSKNVNLGLNVMNQQAGGGGYNYLSAYASMAYTGVRFGANGDQHISMGLSFGVINRRFDLSKLQMGDQWNDNTGLNPLPAGDELLSRTSASSFDAGAGIMYYDANADKKVTPFFGFSAFHLTRPEDPFIADGVQQRMPVRYTVHGGVKYLLSETVSITPNLLYMRQGQAEEKMAGAYMQMNINEEADFLLGANYRFKDALSPYAGVYYKNFVLGMSYDVGTSDLSQVAGRSNSFEISLTIIGHKSAPTKRVPFVCPAL